MKRTMYVMLTFLNWELAHALVSKCDNDLFSLKCNEFNAFSQMQYALFVDFHYM